MLTHAFNRNYTVTSPRTMDAFRTTTGLAMVGQPVPHYYFHRPISALLQTFFRHGFCLDGLVEPTFEVNSKEARVFLRVYERIPAAFVARLRR